jgi:hypothetical protein
MQVDLWQSLAFGEKKRKPGQQQILGVWICLRGSSSKAITEKGAAWSNTCRVLFTAI